jgi:predicted CXXCH cytochrome family protein
VDNLPGQALHFISRDLLNQSTGAGMDVTFGPGQLGSNGVCNMCHAQQTGGPEPLTAYYRDPIISVPDFSDFHTTSADMTGCIQSGCHFSNILTTEHIERNLNCATCHQSNEPRVVDAMDQGNKSCFACHDPHTGGSHLTHVGAAKGPDISCPDCHGTQTPPLLADSQSLDSTAVCDDCHSPSGAYDGVNDPDIGARNNWAGVYNSTDDTLKAGKEKWCAGCHDDAPAVVSGEIAANKTGDNITYGYYVTGHGRDTTYARMSWQDIAASGNPGANQGCDKCHNTASNHITSGVNPDNHRLKDGYGNDQGNSNCNNCHPPGASAAANPQFYTNSSEYEISVHGGKNCTDCHEVHGTAGGFSAMTLANKQNLCDQCHSGHAGHAPGTSFGKGGKTYSLECISCHNVHIITGISSVSAPNRSPITNFSDITKVWGDESSEKMNAYASSGTYRTPRGDTLSGSQLPDYVTFCLDCHGVPEAEFGPHGGISWGSDEPHGLNSANQPNGYGTCPNWYACGKAEGWDNDLCIGDEATCWPVLPRGLGDQLFSRPSYNHEERIAGANFVLSCSDCHVTHESGIGAKLRSTVNNGSGSTIWNTMCNNCHYYYSDWHAGMSCGTASCHVSDRMSSTGTNTIHDMSARTGSTGTRTFNPDLVADMRFENNLKDSGSFQMDGRWYGQYAGGGTGSFVSGKFGQAIQVNGNQPVELGTENDRWSTDAGYHGTWVYSEMKYNMTLEAWVYPTAGSNDENHIFSKHTYTDGGYVLLLKNVGGTLRAALMTNVNGGEVGWNGADCNGLRGAYSTVPIPLHEWTHVAAVFDSSLPDRDINDLSVGRIRIYVNGEDVTTSYPNSNQCYAQPGAGEDYMFPYSDMNIKNESRCYEGHWCASALSIGGVMWGDGSRKGIIGMIDEAKVWNIARTSEYFEYFDEASPPKIVKVEGSVGSDRIYVTLSEGVYASTGQSGSLQSDDFILTDTDDIRTVLSVNHNAGDSLATLTLSSPLDSSNDINVDTLAASASSIYDEYDNPAGISTVTITGQECPTGAAIFQLNESGGSATAADEENVIVGRVNGTGTFAGDGYFHGDGTGNYIDFENNQKCLQATTAMTLETQIKPSIVDDGDGNTIQRVFAKAGLNYQMSIWRNNNSANYPNYTPPDGVASIAFWVSPVDAHGGNAWKPVLTDYDTCPIVADHWYRVKVVWNSSKTGGIPADIFVDDQGTDGSDTGQGWSGYATCTDSDQSQLTDANKLYEGDVMNSEDGVMNIGSNNNHNLLFNGLIDWIKWQEIADYSEVVT